MPDDVRPWHETRVAWRADAAEWEIKRSLGVRSRAFDAQVMRTLEPGLAPAFQQAEMLEDWAHVDDPMCRPTARVGGEHNPAYTGPFVFGNVFAAMQPGTPAPLVHRVRADARARPALALGAGVREQGRDDGLLESASARAGVGHRPPARRGR